MLLNVCVLPPADVAQRCEELSRSLAPDDTVLTLGGGRFAHLTLFMARFPEASRRDAVDAVAACLDDLPGVHCEATGYFRTAGRDLEVSYARTP